MLHNEYNIQFGLDLSLRYLYLDGDAEALLYHDNSSLLCRYAINKMTLEADFDDLVGRHLASLADRFDAELRSQFDEPAPENTTVIFFEYDSPHFADDFAVLIHFLSGRNEAEDSDGFLAGATVVPPAAYLDDKYETIEPWGRASDILVRWLVDRWTKHTGCSLPAYAGHHDSNYCTRLTDGKEMQWDDVTF